MFHDLFTFFHFQRFYIIDRHDNAMEPVFPGRTDTQVNIGGLDLQTVYKNFLKDIDNAVHNYSSWRTKKLLKA